jgi:hypothetical protein
MAAGQNRFRFLLATHLRAELALTNLNFVHGAVGLAVMAIGVLATGAQPQLVPLLHATRLLLEGVI